MHSIMIRNGKGKLQVLMNLHQHNYSSYQMIYMVPCFNNHVVIFRTLRHI